MKKWFIVILLATFGVGAYFGRSTKHDLMISSSTAGASYTGGFTSESANKSNR